MSRAAAVEGVTPDDSESHDGTDEDSNEPERDPRSPDQLTRNLTELLQELRVMQTGVQILTGFLLTVPFAARFEDLAAHQRVLYLVILAGSVLTTLIIVAPVAFHRTLFRLQEREWLVHATHLCARIGLLLSAVVSAGVILLVFDVVAGLATAVAAAFVSLSAFVAVWYGAPRLLSGRSTR